MIELKAAVQKDPSGPLLHLRSFEDTTLEEGFSGISQSDESSGVNGNIVHQSVIKRFIQHSIVVCIKINLTFNWY